jgi:hypothetical protein
LWRAAIVFLLPLAALTWLSLWMIEGFVALYALTATIVYLTGERLLPRPEWLARLLFGCSVKELESDIPTGPAWLEAVLSLVARVVAAPLATPVRRLVADGFCHVRRQMTPFLISRAIVAQRFAR